MIKAVFPGSFDPPTFGHLDIVERARSMFEEVHVLIAVNKNKTALFSAEERSQMFKTLCAQWDNVVIALHDGLIVEYAQKAGINVLIRGIRNMHDFMYEFDIAFFNKAIRSGVETIFVPTDQRFFFCNSSAVKEIAAFGGDVSAMAPPVVVEALKKKFAKST